MCTHKRIGISKWFFLCYCLCMLDFNLSPVTERFPSSHLTIVALSKAFWTDVIHCSTQTAARFYSTAGKGNAALGKSGYWGLFY